MPQIQYPVSLQIGEAVGVTAPSSGVGPDIQARLQYCISWAESRGFKVLLGECLRSSAIVSASAQQRASELRNMLQREDIRAIVPPWGGELLINILPYLEFENLATLTPKWIVGYSDLSTLLMPYTMLTGIATLHGGNFMEGPYEAPGSMLHWLKAITTLSEGSRFTQSSSAQFQEKFTRFQDVPNVTVWNYQSKTQWKLLGKEDCSEFAINVSGRLMGGCLEVVSMLPGTPYGDVASFAKSYAPEGLLLYLEVCDSPAATACRMFHHLRLAGWFNHANAVLLGRTQAPDSSGFTQRDAIADSLSDLGIPVIYDMDIGHVPPQMLLINGALATVRCGGGSFQIEQALI